MSLEKIKLTTKSGIPLEFSVLAPNANWNDVPGIYIFCTKSGTGYNPLYIGKASSFKSRFANHEHWDGARRLGMTHVLAMIVRNQADRDKIESTLIAQYKPPLNTQGK